MVELAVAHARVEEAMEVVPTGRVLPHLVSAKGLESAVNAHWGSGACVEHLRQHDLLGPQRVHAIDHRVLHEAQRLEGRVDVRVEACLDERRVWRLVGNRALELRGGAAHARRSLALHEHAEEADGALELLDPAAGLDERGDGARVGRHALGHHLSEEALGLVEVAALAARVDERGVRIHGWLEAGGAHLVEVAGRKR